MPSTVRNGVYFFTNDLRIHDNPALTLAAQEVDCLVCVFCYPTWWGLTNQQQLTSLGKHRAQFLAESLADLADSLSRLNQHLIVTQGSISSMLNSLSNELNIDVVYHSEQAGVYEQQEWAYAQKKYPEILFSQHSSHTLFSESELPFSLQKLPETFSKFRKLIETDNVNFSPNALNAVTKLPRQPTIDLTNTLPSIEVGNEETKRLDHIRGGETAALTQLEYYFTGNLPANYKQVRNSLDGWDNSSKFSPWLANGCLSVKRLIQRLHNYESTVIKNKSTYWIYFEVLWREYFQWYAHKYQQRLFRFQGIKKRKPLTSFYSERFQKWRNGTTPYSLVNACMRELTSTGFLSNRGRQIVASCLVNELAIDWRYGAAYFEHHLIDYDVASNWGNWQYLAGVGADARDNRRFNLEKQADLFDPDFSYRKKWECNLKQNTLNSLGSLDSVDAADWPIE